MEDRSQQASTAPAAIVRDFQPSRLERQLLVQAFELAWRCRPEARLHARRGGATPARDRLFGPTATSALPALATAEAEQ